MAITFRNLGSSGVINHLNSTSRELSRTFDRLSSGLRINSASDDAAGLAISAGLKRDARVYNQGLRNANDGVSALNIADGALGSLSSILTRVSELAEQSANGVYSLTQRKALNAEAGSLIDEYNRIVSSTTFNGINLLAGGQGETRIQMGYGVDASLGFIFAQYLERAQGSGTFATKIDVATSNAGQSSASADFNGDGYDDIVTSTGPGTTSTVLLSNGDGTFSSVNLSLAASSSSVLAGDVDNNGTQDVVLTDTSGRIYFFAGAGDGTFAAAQQTATGISTPLASQLVDLDGNGSLDLLFRSGSSVYLSTYSSNGLFSTASTILTESTSLLDIGVGDFNGDGKSDFTYSSAASTSNKIYLGNGSGGFSYGSSYTTIAGNNIDVGDINGDGYDDIVSADGSANVLSFIATSVGTVQAGVSVSGISATKVLLEDINGDGTLDIVGTNGTTLTTSFGNGNGTFLAGQTTTTSISNAFPTLGDFNGDGALDIALSNTNDLDVHMANTSDVSTIGKVYLLDQEGALEALTTIKEIMAKVSKEQGQIGANMSRLSSSISNLRNLTDNYTIANSRITDVDVAEESAKVVGLKILQQAQVALLAQSKQTSNIILDLLRA